MSWGTCYIQPVDASASTSIGPVDQRAEWLAAARKVMETEAQAILAASARLDNSLIAAVETILGHSGKLIVTGLSANPVTSPARSPRPSKAPARPRSFCIPPKRLTATWACASPAIPS